jgi:hypothetical protein
MATIRLVDLTDVSADTGVQNTVYAGGGGGELLTSLRMRNKVNVPEDPYTGGQVLVTIGWNDGVVAQEWNVAIQTFADNYNEQGIQIWQDIAYPITYRVQPLVGGGSVDVVVLHADS